MHQKIKCLWVLLGYARAIYQRILFLALSSYFHEWTCCGIDSARSLLYAYFFGEEEERSTLITILAVISDNLTSP